MTAKKRKTEKKKDRKEKDDKKQSGARSKENDKIKAKEAKRLHLKWNSPIIQHETLPLAILNYLVKNTAPPES